VHRGSLFANQELAIAFILEFEQAIFLQQEGVERNGLLKYMGSNAQGFRAPSDVPRLVKKLVLDRAWDPSYTRHLDVGATRWGENILFGDHTGQRPIRVFFVDIVNRRRELGATNAIARLERIVHSNGRIQKDVDRSPLKTTGQPGFVHVIWPESHAAWDVLSVAADRPSTVYLNSALDVPRTPLITSPGEYILGYEVFAERFPVLRFGVKLLVAGNPSATTATLVKSPHP
jgi:hypothetical protein